MPREFTASSIVRFDSLILSLLLLVPAAISSAPNVESRTSDKSDWWAFKPATRPALPASNLKSGISNPIDAFIRAKLTEQKLEPSPEADSVTLIRRLTYDLTGLPPTPEEVDAFTQSAIRNPQSAIEHLAARLLASPRYGERWARHWLDVVHFGETHGYDKDKLRPHAWPYRDYVIRSLNGDEPWSRFVEEQLSGDVLYPDDPDGIVALGFIAAGPWDYVGHAELPETKTDGLIARYNDRDDMVMTTMSSFQSLTVHCARCHDHKFDPISQRDYYSLQAVFAGVDRANRPYDIDPAAHRRRRELTSEQQLLEKQRDEIKSSIAKLASPDLVLLDQQISSLNSRLTGAPTNVAKKSSSNGYHSGIEPKPDATKWVQIDLGRAVAIDEIRLVPARPTDFPDAPGFGFPVRFKVEVSHEPEFVKPMTLSDHTREDFKNPGDTAFTVRIPESADARYIRITATRLWERTHDYVFALGELQAFAGGTNLARGTTVTAFDSIEAGRWSKKNLVDGFSSRARLNDAAPTPLEFVQRREAEAELNRVTTERQREFDSLIPAELKAQSVRVESRLAEITNALAVLPPPKLVYAAASDFKSEGSFHPPKGMRPVHFLPRGDVKQPKELMPPAAPGCVPGPNASFNLAENHTESARRAALARWLTDPRNLQTRRSIVNRVWHYHFGRGLVDTPNDFGHMGSVPTHPELLDWLAFWFLENGESLKKLHRLIVTSATYRQTSGTADARRFASATTVDQDNRLLWRQNRTRLDAECIRDAMLAVSGQLDLTMGGPSDRQFFFKDDHSPVYDYTRFDTDSKEGRRRSIYRHIVRSVVDPFMDCLDAADPSQLVARRNTTLTALQALATLNNPFVLKQCEHFASRLEREAPSLPAQVERAYHLTLSRGPSTAEKTRLTTYARQHGLANACRVLFNSTEFMFVD